MVFGILICVLRVQYVLFPLRVRFSEQPTFICAINMGPCCHSSSQCTFFWASSAFFPMVFRHFVVGFLYSTVDEQMLGSYLIWGLFVLLRVSLTSQKNGFLHEYTKEWHRHNQWSQIETYQIFIYFSLHLAKWWPRTFDCR